MLRMRLALTLTLGVFLVSGAIPAAAAPRAQTGPDTPACQTATAFVTTAKASLRRANRTLAKAKTAKAKRAARRKVASAKARLKTLQRRQVKACTAPANQPPSFPSPVQINSSTEFTYDDTGRLSGAVTTIKVVSQPTDPDGDTLTYAWTATNGTITSDGLAAWWNRVLVGGRVQPGSVTVTVSDGHGGQAQHTIELRG